MTVKQPYASRLVQGEKRIENRSRPTSRRGVIAIHAGKALHEHYRAEHVDGVADMPRSVIVGTVEIVDCHEATLGCSVDGVDCSALGGFVATSWEPVFHWVVTNPQEARPPLAHARGALGFWVVPADIEHEVVTGEASDGR
ncbi:ASCH domain-containing protein [Frondihabitans sp. 762G35]|uniref:ASCH domain-containing protein n=1 Tax=Frondihabitans sp. 762G35 TaxID=1446794 RepID=UPI0013DBDA01|nr:ASCH domain-containing protein [Frondihabitans sp. 762G35]